MKDYNKVVKSIVHKTYRSVNPGYSEEIKEMNCMNNVLSRRITMVIDGNEQKPYQTWSYRYNELGKVVYESYRFLYVDPPEEEERTFEYDSEGILIKSTYHKNNKEFSLEPNGYTQYEYFNGHKTGKRYDEQGKLTDIIHYDENDNIIQSDAYIGTNIVKSYHYYYDRNGNKIKATYRLTTNAPDLWKASEDKVNVPVLSDEWEYDERGNEITHYNYNNDGTIRIEVHQKYDSKNQCIHYYEKDALSNRVIDCTIRHEEYIKVTVVPKSHSNAEPVKSSTQNPNERDLLEDARDGNSDAMASVAEGFYSGNAPFPKDDTKAFFWSKKATETDANNNLAWTLLGKCYQFGVGTQKNFPLAIEAYKKSAELGNPDSMYCLAELYYLDMPDDQKHQCVPWLEKAYVLGHNYATTLLGRLYLHGEYVTKDVIKGESLLVSASQKGDSQAARLLAQAYWDGDIEPRSEEKAIQWYNKAYDLGDEDNWRVLYYAGLAKYYGKYGVRQNLEEARSALSRLPEFYEDNKGIRDYVVRANAILGCMCFEGEGGPIDKVMGEKCLREAINSTPIEEDDRRIITQSKNDLGMYLYSINDRINEAIKLIEEAANLGNSDAQVNLGNAYYEGKGVQRNQEKAIYYYTMAAKQGNSTAKELLLRIGKSHSTGHDTSSIKKICIGVCIIAVVAASVLFVTRMLKEQSDNPSEKKSDTAVIHPPIDTSSPTPGSVQSSTPETIEGMDGFASIVGLSMREVALILGDHYYTQFDEGEIAYYSFYPEIQLRLLWTGGDVSESTVSAIHIDYHNYSEPRSYALLGKITSTMSYNQLKECLSGEIDLGDMNPEMNPWTGQEEYISYFSYNNFGFSFAWLSDSKNDYPVNVQIWRENSTIVLSEFSGNIADYRKVPFTSAEASSEVHYNGKVYWASNAIDGDMTTSWQEEVEGDGIGEYLVAYFDSAMDVDLIRLRLGYASYYERNGRPKTLRFDFSDSSTTTYEFADINQDFYLRFDKTVHTSFIKLTIIDAYTGSEWADTCITEVTAYQLAGSQGKGEQLLRGNSTYIGFVDISSVTGKYCIQCGSFATNVSSDYAENYAKTMVEAENELGNSLQVYVTIRNGYYAVCLGPFASKEDAVYHRDLLATIGYDTIVALYQ